MQKIIKRLELIKNSIALEDEEIIEIQLIRLQQMELDEPVRAIINSINRREFSSVITDIDRYIDQFRGMVVYEDGELYGLRLELKVLEGQVEELADQRNDLQFQLDQFNYHYQLQLGELIQGILKVREGIQLAKIRQQQKYFQQQVIAYHRLKDEVVAIKQRKVELENELELCDEFSDEYDRLYESIQEIQDELRQNEKMLHQQRQQAKTAKENLEESPEYESYQDAKQESDQFNQHYQEVVTEDRIILEKSEELELKLAYKQAARLCHPDLVDDDLKEQATSLMQALNEAKKKQDLPAVNEILQRLKKLLRAKIDQLRQTIKQFEVDILEIQQSETWKILDDMEDINEYICEVKIQLEEEHTNLKHQLAELKQAELEMEEQATIDTANSKFDEIHQSRQSPSGFNPKEVSDYFDENLPDDDDEFWREEF
jgi:DNA repair exonuclease SbcCD ATPase subunit